MLHIQGGWEPTSASAELNKVHQTLNARYKQQAYGQGSLNNVANAKYLQDFLQAWKQYANTGVSSSNIFKTALLEAISSSFPKNMAFKFNQAGGVKFEKSFSNFIVQLLNNPVMGTSLNENIDSALKKTMAGAKHVTSSKSGTVNLIDLDEVAYELLRTTRTTVDNNLRQLAQEGMRGLDSQRARISGKEISVQGKTDISAKMVEWKINIEAPAEIHKVVTLLAKAQFTAKNYGSGYWAREQMKKRGMDPNSLHFGNSNVWRAINAVLGELGYNSQIIKSIYYSAYAGADANAQLHLYHIRFVYELTGLGQHYIDQNLQQFGEAQFLIYNDYNSNNIYVRSTAELILDMYKEIFDGDWQKAIRITKNVVTKNS